jgi:hypothetical protein
MNPPANEPREYGFAIGLLTGVCVGIALAIRIVPRASARRLRQLTSDEYEQDSTRVGEAGEEVARSRHDVRDKFAGALLSGRL